MPPLADSARATPAGKSGKIKTRSAESAVSFPFSHHFQRYLSETISSIVEPSATFVSRFDNFELMIRISAKTGIEENEIRGPTVFKKSKEVEYTVFVPFDVIVKESDVARTALRFLLKGICSVLQSLEVSTRRIERKQESMIERICSDPIMFK